MNKILYVSNDEDLEIDLIKNLVKKSNSIEFTCIHEKTIEDSMEHFFDTTEPIMLLILSEDLEGLDEFVISIKTDEAFTLLPVILILEELTLEKRKKYLSFGIDAFLSKNYDKEEFVLASSILIKEKLKHDKYITELSEVTELNITKSIQLDILRKYIPATVWDKTVSLAENQRFQIKEEEQELAIIFGDIKSFTTLTEKLSPAEVISHLNLVFDIATQIIYYNYGDVDKFIGDAFLAVFNSSAMAVLSAIVIQEELTTINRIRNENNEETVKLRLGLHYGKVIRGSVGGTMRYDNTLIGDPINTAQRLEILALEEEILASKKVLSKLDIFPVDEMDFKEYTLKGKDKKVHAIYLMDYYKKNPEIKDKLYKMRSSLKADFNTKKN